jgi:ankyrin repeat protein
MSDLFGATTAAEVEECLARGKDIEQESMIEVRKDVDSMQTPLTNSIMRGNKQVFFSLLQHGANPNHNPPESIKPIQMAAAEGWKDMVEALVKAGADVNERRGGAGTPLLIAAVSGAVDVTEGLLALGADPDTMSNGWTPLIKACLKGNLKKVGIAAAMLGHPQVVFLEVLFSHILLLSLFANEQIR